MLDYGTFWRIEWKDGNVTRSGTRLVNYHRKCSVVPPFGKISCVIGPEYGTITNCLPAACLPA